MHLAGFPRHREGRTERSAAGRERFLAQAHGSNWGTAGGRNQVSQEIPRIGIAGEDALREIAEPQQFPVPRFRECDVVWEAMEDVLPQGTLSGGAPRADEAAIARHKSKLGRS